MRTKAVCMSSLLVLSIFGLGACRRGENSTGYITPERINWTSPESLALQTVAGVATLTSIDQCSPGACMYLSVDAGPNSALVDLYGLRWEEIIFGEGPATTVMFAQNAKSYTTLAIGSRYVVAGYGELRARGCADRAAVDRGIVENDILNRLTMALLADDNSYEIALDASKPPTKYTLEQLRGWSAQAKKALEEHGAYPPLYNGDFCDDAGVPEDAGEDAAR